MSSTHLARCLPVLLLAACSGAPEMTSEEASDSSQENIVRGTVDAGHPQVMALLVPRADGSQEFCTATLYARRTLLTAAHCLVGAELVLAYHGNDFMNAFDQLGQDPKTWTNWAQAVDWKIHPKWDPKTWSADIAVVHIDRDPPFPPLPLATKEIGKSYVGSMAQLVGYGGLASEADNATPIDAFIKRFGTTKYQGTPAASPLPPNPHPGLGIRAIREQLMQFDGKAPYVNACFGDSGGPALMSFAGKYQVVGVATWTGDYCRDFSYYTRVFDFAPFLTEQALPKNATPPLPL
ncbi:MAG TPA: S1 family peptidase [Polyangiaceae bacterium]|nr:S1 family peptidase [Polyangiaceae bacterium]